MVDPTSLTQNRIVDARNRRIALCLGSHRSGTSLLAAAIEVVGAELSLPDRKASEENLKGFFEHAEIVALDDDLQRLANSAWDDAMFDGQSLGTLPQKDLEELRRRAHSIVEAQLRPAFLSAIKDPRMCRLLPFWLQVLKGVGYASADIRCVIVTRDPVEIAISQRTRCRQNPDFYNFGGELAEGIALWLNHIRQALRDCEGHQILVISYHDFLKRPAELMAQLASFLDTRPDQDAIDRFVMEFVNDSLWRSHADDGAIAEIEAAFPGLLRVERTLAALSGQIVHVDALRPILDALGNPAFDAAVEDIVSRAYGRLSGLRREERQEALRTSHALEVAQQAREKVTEVAQDLERRLREQIAVLQAGLSGRDAAQKEMLSKHETVLAEALEVEGSLREHIGELETGIVEREQRLDLMHKELEAGTLEHERSLDLMRKELEAGTLEHERRLDLMHHEQGIRLAELSALIENLSQSSDYLQRVNDAMRVSHSWRLTWPLRAAGTAARSLKRLPQAGLRRLNRVAQVAHQQLKRKHPRTAELGRRAIQPLMMQANMKLLGQYNEPAPLQNPASLPEGMFAFDYQQPRVHPEHRPLVTVIVPNFNHAAYLVRRLESIYAQTYDNFEVLLLDDCSSDNSREVLQSFANRYPERTRTLFNQTNSGGVFRQWEKGFAAARGELVWIAESDDWASPNFLETLVPFFQNEGVQLAYARTNFMDGAGEKQIWSMEEYLNQFGPERWARAWVETAPDIVREVFSMVNVIPNVSSALFRRFERLDVLEIDEWRDMRTCGDWMFYLNAIRGGLVAYSPDAQNFYRIHDKNTSVSSHKADQFYREHEAVAKCIRRHYRVPTEKLARMDANLRHQWKITRSDYSESAFAACFDLARIEAAPACKPTLLMVGYAFCAGGGETFPIQLANEMKAIGYEVTFLDCAQEARVEGVRARLANDIPVISNFPDLRRIVRNFDIDLIHSHHGWADNTVLDLIPEPSDCRTIITLHGFYETMPSEQLKLLLPRMLRRTAAIVYIAEKNLSITQDFRVPIKSNFHRIDNAVSRACIGTMDRASLGIASDAFVLTLVSRALHAKGWAEAIASTGRAREISGRDIRLVLVGEGEAKDAAEAAGVPPHVHIQGFRANTQDYFAIADLGFLPSRFKGESFPLVVIESLIVGTPVLASDIGEIRNMLTTADGLAGALIELEGDQNINIERLAAQIAALAMDPDEMARLQARVSLAAERFDPRRMAVSYDEVYRKTTLWRSDGE